METAVPPRHRRVCVLLPRDGLARPQLRPSLEGPLCPQGAPRGDHPTPKGAAMPPLPLGPSSPPRAPPPHPGSGCGSGRPPLPATLSSALPERLALRAVAQLSRPLPGLLSLLTSCLQDAVQKRSAWQVIRLPRLLCPQRAREPCGRCLVWSPSAGEGPGSVPVGPRRAQPCNHAMEGALAWGRGHRRVLCPRRVTRPGAQPL